jgi:isocitrate lyase
MASIRNSLRGRLQRGETVVAPGAYDSMSARVVQALGFPAVYTGGYMTGAHTSIMEPLLTLTEHVEVAHKVARAVDLPVIADAGAGYGDPLHVMRCVRGFEAAGSPASTSKTRCIPNGPPTIRVWSTSSPCRNSSSASPMPGKRAGPRTSSSSGALTPSAPSRAVVRNWAAAA